jgi:S1-C subfamily serine protease
MFEQPTQYPEGPGSPVPAPPDAPAPRRSGRRKIAALAAAGALLAGGGVLVGAELTGGSTVVAGAGSATQLPSTDSGNGTSPGSGGWGIPGFGGSGGTGGSGSGGSGSGGSSTTTGATTSATAAQQVGVVDINTVLGYQQARAAGTGMVLTSAGEVLTNNHVVNGATSISVTVVSTGKTYTAAVVGTDPTQDVAVIQLQNASGLQTANLGNSGTVQVGNSVTGVGNAGGVGGTPSAAAGTVTAVNQTITASDGNGQDAETLNGLIQTNAPIQAGDSGGPLYDSTGHVIGMDTAASSSGGVGPSAFPNQGAATATTAYAIPIDSAVGIARQIETGVETSTIHIGLPGFLGVSVADSTVSGAAISSVVTGGPAATAGLAAGDVITAVNGTSITDAAALHTALVGKNPGQTVTLTWTDSLGQTHHSTVTLGTGPAD